MSAANTLKFASKVWAAIRQHLTQYPPKIRETVRSLHYDVEWSTFEMITTEKAPRFSSDMLAMLQL